MLLINFIVNYSPPNKNCLNKTAVSLVILYICCVCLLFCLVLLYSSYMEEIKIIIIVSDLDRFCFSYTWYYMYAFFSSHVLWGLVTLSM